MRKSVLLLFVLVTIVGCTSIQQYSGSELPDGQIAIVEKQEAVYGNFYVTAINGKWRGIGSSDRYKFLPGPVELHVTYSASTSSSTTGTNGITVTADLQAGNTYLLKYLILNNRFTAWIEEKDSGTKVSK